MNSAKHKRTVVADVSAAMGVQAADPGDPGGSRAGGPAAGAGGAGEGAVRVGAADGEAAAADAAL